MNSVIVRGTPQAYCSEIGAWERLPDYCQEQDFQHLFIIRGEASWQAAQPFWPHFKPEQVLAEVRYNGSCSDSEIHRLAQEALALQADVIIGVGGGKILDNAKGVAHALGKPVILLPTLASTCAACTPLSVIYHDSGAMDRFDIYPHASDLVLVEPGVIANSPHDYLVAGIGDTLAKWYEADLILRQLEQPSIPLQVAHQAAKNCQLNLLEASQGALAALAEQKVTKDLVTIIDTNLLVAGMVGGFGDEYGRTSGAHAIHDGLTVLADSHQILHGKKVAYGILVQLQLEGQFAEIKRLAPFYAALGLPRSFKEMQMAFTPDAVAAVAERATLPEEPIHAIKANLSADDVVAAMHVLEK